MSTIASPDLTGAQDGSVRMFEWGHSQQIICFRSPGNSRVTRIRFNHQGNKARGSHAHVCKGCCPSHNLLTCSHADSRRDRDTHAHVDNTQTH